MLKEFSMPLSRVDRERLVDSSLRIESVLCALGDLDDSKLPQFQEIQECLRDAEECILLALRE
jgi:hypothetical protein